MANVGNADPPKDFAHAFGDALNHFLEDREMGQSEVARLLGLEAGEGEKRKGGARIHSYLHDSKDGKRTKPDAEVLFLACTKLQGFSFVYNGHKINAEIMNGAKPPDNRERPAEQLTLEFERQFNLTHRQGTVEVSVSRPPGRIEISVSLIARAS
jgi:hypothetical protein